jgi:hypothetical protein
MSKAQKIRAALESGKSLSKEQIAAAVGFKLNNPMTYFATGELLSEGPQGSKTYRLNPDYAPPHTRPAAKRKKRLKGAVAMQRERAARKTAGKTLKDIAARLREPTLRDLALDNYIGAGELLRTALREGVEDIEANPALAAAIANHERAEKIVRAA